MTHEEEARKIFEGWYKSPMSTESTLVNAIATALRKRDELYDAAWSECESSRFVVSPDPIYGWREPRHADSDAHDDEYADLGKNRDAHDTLRREAGKEKA